MEDLIFEISLTMKRNPSAFPLGQAYFHTFDRFQLLSEFFVRCSLFRFSEYLVCFLVDYKTGGRIFLKDERMTWKLNDQSAVVEETKFWLYSECLHGGEDS